MLSFQIHEHSLSLYLFWTFVSNSFISILWFSSAPKFSTSFVRFTCNRRFFLAILNCINGIVFLNWVFMCSFLAYKNIVDFCVYLLYYMTLLNSLTSSRSCFFRFIEIFYVTSCYLGTETILFLPFCSYAFYFFLLIAMASISSNKLNRSDESQHPCLVSFYGESIQSSTMKQNFNCAQ